MKILVIEDDKSLLDFLEGLLIRWGHIAITANSGKKGLKAMDSSIDLVLMDIFLEDIMGYYLIPQIRSLSPDAKIITMTGNNCRALENRIRSQNILYYMIKPFEIKYLKCLLDHIDHKKIKNTREIKMEAINE